jgi:hypothetical protein
MTTPALSFEGPLDPQSFRGRAGILKQIFDRLQNKALLSSSIVGGPLTGKTSLLRYIASAQADKLAPKVLRIYVDAEPLGANARPTDFWISVFRALGRLQLPAALATALTKVLERARDNKLDIYDLEDLFDSFAGAGTPVAIAIDNFQILLNNTNFWPPATDFFHVARSLSQRLPRGVAYITATLRPLLDLWDPTRNASPYYNIFANILVARMDGADVRALVIAHCDSAGVNHDGALVDLVSAASDQHPYLLGRVAHFLVQRLVAKEAADIDSLGVLVDDVNGPYVTLTRQIRLNLAAWERQLLDSPRQQLSSSNRDILVRLRDYGLLPPGTEV